MQQAGLEQRSPSSRRDQSPTWEPHFAVLPGGTERGAEGALGGGWPGQGVRSKGRRVWGAGSRGRGTEEMGIPAPAGAESAGPERVREGGGPVQAGKERRRKWAPKKEVRNCGGGSRPWKRRGKGEARVECLHFREGRAGASSKPGGGGRPRGKRRSPGCPGVPAALPEALLPRRVPQLQLDPLARLDLQQAGEEVHADRGVAGGGAQPGEAALGEAVQEARLAHRGVPDYDEAELVDPNGLHRSRALAARGPPHPSCRRGASLAAGTVPSAPPGRPPAGFQHIPATAAAAWSPPSLEGGAGPGQAGGGASGQWAGRGPQLGWGWRDRPGWLRPTPAPALGKSLSPNAHWAPPGRWVWRGDVTAAAANENEARAPPLGSANEK